MTQIETSIVINASPEKVWEILTDFDQYPKWNPFIRTISGDRIVGGKLKVFIKPPDAGGMMFKPSVLQFNMNKELRWKGNLGIPGLFDGEHYFMLNKLNANTTEFIQGEKFSGILVGLFRKMLIKTKDGFELMNKALKLECENYTTKEKSKVS